MTLRLGKSNLYEMVRELSLSSKPGKRFVPGITIPEKPVTNIFVPRKKKGGKVSNRKPEVRKAKKHLHTSECHRLSLVFLSVISKKIIYECIIYQIY